MSEDPLTLPTFYVVKSSSESGVAVEAEQAKSLSRSYAESNAHVAQEREMTAVPPRMNGTFIREARSRISALSSAEVAEELLRMGVGPGLASALEAGADLLTLSDVDLLAMGIQEWYSRDLVLRTIAYILASEQHHLAQMGEISRTGDNLPMYS
ncbi:hypothetical protein HDU96_001162 [Phlyctochytrium bullatum]|nr:hypothetical protein HDU96_001162 [Phlyctochytrium bullatum]